MRGSTTAAQVWDASTAAALDAITPKYENRGTTVTITGMNTISQTATTGSPATSPAATDPVGRQPTSSRASRVA